MAKDFSEFRHTLDCRIGNIDQAISLYSRNQFKCVDCLMVTGFMLLHIEDDDIIHVFEFVWLSFVLQK